MTEKSYIVECTFFFSDKSEKFYYYDAKKNEQEARRHVVAVINKFLKGWLVEGESRAPMLFPIKREHCPLWYDLASEKYWDYFITNEEEAEEEIFINWSLAQIVTIRAVRPKENRAPKL